MHGTRWLIVTRRYQTNKRQTNSNYSTQQPHFERRNLIEREMDHSKMNYNDNNQTARYFRVEGQFRYHWGAEDQDTMSIINRREKSPETSELVTRRNELARQGAKGPHWNRNLGREIYVPRGPEDERRKIMRIDLQRKRKEKESRIVDGYFRKSGDEIPRRPTLEHDQTNMNETLRENETIRDAESTISNSSEEAVATHERTRSLPRNTRPRLPRRSD